MNAIDFTMDIEEFGGMMAFLLKVVNPTINENRTFEYIMEMLASDMSPQTVQQYGEFIRATSMESDGVH